MAILNAIIENKGNTLIIDFPHSIYDVYGKLLSIGIRKSPNDIMLTDNEDDDIQVKLYSDSDFGNHVIRLLGEDNSLADANTTAYLLMTADDEFKDELEQNILYNWDDGFEVPRTILADPDCDLALALEIFYLAGGYEYLEKSAKRTKLQKWNPFITVLYEDILDNRFPKTDASFEIPLSKVQKYKLRKKGAAEIFLTDL